MNTKLHLISKRLSPQRAVLFIFISVFTFTTLFPTSVFGLIDERFYSSNEILYFNPDSCGGGAKTTSTVGAKNTDYKNRQILSEAELAAVKENQPTYEEAEKQSGVPWEAIAVLHYRETRFKRVNPSNGQGIYQDYEKSNGPYPTGAVSDAEFLRQTVWAGNFLKGKASDPDLLAKGDAGQIKDAFFGYNGRSSQYAAQAKRLGFKDPYEGSPYVMNKADALRDPESNPSGWGQISVDGGSIVFPANADYGSFVVYTSLAGGEVADCKKGSSDLRTAIVEHAQAELELWESGALKPGSDFKKYTYGTSGDWCAWFVSWILKESGKPVDDTDTPDWPTVSRFAVLGPSIGLIVHQNDGSYTARPGDIALYKDEDYYHVNIVIEVAADGQITTIGGNEGSEPYTTSSVKKNVGYGNRAYQFVSVD